MSVGLHRKKKVPWPVLPLWIRLYEIKILKDADVEAKDIVKFDFDTKDFNSYDPHSIFNDHVTRMYFSWTHETFHWLEDDPWRYCYNVSNLHEPVSIARTWKDALQTIVGLEETKTTKKGYNPMQEKGERKVA